MNQRTTAWAFVVVGICLMLPENWQRGIVLAIFGISALYTMPVGKADEDASDDTDKITSREEPEEFGLR